MNTRKFISPFFIRLTLIVFSIVNIYPVIFTIFTSLKPRDEFYDNLWGVPNELYLDNYTEAFEIGQIGDYLFNSVIIAIVSLLLIIVLGAIAAYALAKLSVPFEAAIVGFLFILMVLPAESMIIPLYMMMSELGLLGIPYVPIIIAYVGWLLPGSIIILRNFFLTIPTELMEAARIDGSTEIQTMFKIVLPLSGPAIATITVFNFGSVWGELMWAQIATLNTNKGVPISVGLINLQGQFTTNWGLLTAGICLVLVPLIVMFIFLQKYFVKGLSGGAVKG